MGLLCIAREKDSYKIKKVCHAKREIIIKVTKQVCQYCRINSGGERKIVQTIWDNAIGQGLPIIAVTGDTVKQW